MNIEEIKNAMADLEEDTLMELMNGIMENGGEGVNEAVAGMQEGMQEVGSRFESGEYFVCDLIYAGEIMTGAMEIIKPALSGDGSASAGRMILCTVKDDLHDIGKNLVIMMIESAGFEVIDLGVDVPAQTFVDTYNANPDTKIIGLSALLTTTMPQLQEAVALINKQPWRSNVKVMVGGAPITQEFADKIGADAYTTDAASAAQKAKELVG